MILRRVIKHVRKQEWTAIMIDLIIVVVGVYVGIQAQAWNAERQDREIEERYLLSLHASVGGAQGDRRSTRRDRRRTDADH